MKVLITGGNGFLGGRLALFFSQQSVCDLVVATRSEVHKKLPNVTYLKMDLSQSADELKQLLSDVDCIIHLAALNDRQSFADPVLANDVNVGGTIKLLAAATAASVRRFIYFSTAHIYGSPLVGAISERSLPRPVHPYAITHKSAEDYVLMAHDKGEIEGVILRLSNGFGYPHDIAVNCSHLLVNDLCQQVMRDKKIVLKSSGQQYRNFIPIGNIVSAVQHCIFMDKSKIDDGVFNLGETNSMRVIEMAQLIAEKSAALLGYSCDITVAPLSENEQHLPLTFDCQKIKKTGFLLADVMDIELEKTLAFYNAHFA